MKILFPKRRKKNFDYFISLGDTCPIASSMAKYGLRSFSGPFDWLVTSDFSWVLRFMETDFQDFLLSENLQRIDDNTNRFRDKKSDFRFIHDTEDFEKEYDKLKEKYDQLINNFMEKSKFKVCYLRSIRTEKELEYVKNNSAYIKYVIRKNNAGSEIVFLSDIESLMCDDLPFRYYHTPGMWGGASRMQLRAYFDGADDFLNFCGENYAGVNLMKNLSFDFRQCDSYERAHILNERKYKTLTTLLEHDFCNDILPEKIIIYGADIIGRELHRKINDLTSIVCFADQDKAGTEYNSIKIISPDEVEPKEGLKIIVTAVYDFENIRKTLLDKFQVEDIISLGDIIDLKF